MRLGVDLGGTKIEVLALADTGEQLLRRRIPTPKGDYPATLAAITRLVQEAEAELGQRGSVGIGIPGTLAGDTGLVKNANSTCLIGQALQQDLEARLQRPLRLANDANCFALSEAVDGAAAGARAVFGAILGTGVGGGMVLDGKVWGGANGIAGEWGHNPLPGEPDGPPCYCGRRGCTETWLSGPALAADHLRHTGMSLSPQAIVAGAEAGMPACEATLVRYETRLARALGGVINLFDPEVIVLGGGLSRLERLYQRVPGLWGAHVFSDTICTRLLPPRHGDSSGVRGAAWLWEG
ncbi:MAG: ROK family protein [Azovibrio sp.]|uniref:ROK family protein n=1 Tax=Azovibrio sp. TaxID=1872673 RepID=UPI003C71E3F0